MPGINTTGTPNTADYNLGRGIVQFAPLLANGLPGAYEDLGNAPEFKISVATEKLKHASSRAGLKTTDKEVVISQEANLSFTLDEMNFGNWARFLSGNTAAYTNAAIAGFTIWTAVAAGTITKARYYDVTNAAGLRAYDIDDAKLVVKTTNGSPVTLVLGTDYTLDNEMGRIFLLSTSTALDTAIAGTEGLTFTLTAKAGAKTVSEVQGLTTSSVRGALKFIGANPANNDKRFEVQVHQISIKSDGDCNLISDDWSSMGFTGIAEVNSLVPGNSKSVTIRNVA